MDRPRSAAPPKSCRACGMPIERKFYNGRLEDLGVFKRRKHCSLNCVNTPARPSHWGTYHWRARQHRSLSFEACGLTENLRARHVDGRPPNNAPENIQTLCTYCHNFLHATAGRRGWILPERLLPLRQLLASKPSETPPSRKSLKRSVAPSCKPKD